MRRLNAIILLVTLAVGVIVLSGGGAAWHVSLDMNTTEHPNPPNASSSSEYALNFTEGGPSWNFDEIRLFFDGDVSLTQVGRQSIRFLENGDDISIDDVDGGELTDAEQDVTDREWNRVLRIELDEEMDGTEFYRVVVGSVRTPTSPGTYHLTLNTYNNGDLSTNRNGPDSSSGDKTIEYEIYEAQEDSSNLLLYLLLLAAAAGGYYYYKRRNTAGAPSGGGQQAPGQHGGQPPGTGGGRPPGTGGGQPPGTGGGQPPGTGGGQPPGTGQGGGQPPGTGQGGGQHPDRGPQHQERQDNRNRGR